MRVKDRSLCFFFPGLIFTKAATVRSWMFKSVSLASSDSYDISLQVYRPSCPSGSGALLQPGNTKGDNNVIS